ncbi:hypothetical protein AK812_SmicGene4452 [Symbiodinium microadriaticum]|uniref:Uncharacterized protein n=1 Tax=Symbiodinium microadriaticum TaxID=2951 RepID=A0A1Q9EW98_SYMMI|nr:hypothetical protein AK812_SmicGene4452 [Symbiodinium microadriaticum]CAE7645649.1 unnamed protein product [Symbiodinium sp. KB8]CAE7661335.1 unnamed protein product [Symbiodinium microadriaticum]
MKTLRKSVDSETCAMKWCNLSSSLYIFWDPECGGDLQGPGWFLSSREPDPSRTRNLHDVAGGCSNWAHWRTATLQVAGTRGWSSWDTCCSSTPGRSFFTRVEAARKAANQVYHLAGTTAAGQHWYVSSEKIEGFSAHGYAHDPDQRQGETAQGDGVAFPLALPIAFGILLNILVLSLRHWRRRAAASVQEPEPPPLPEESAGTPVPTSPGSDERRSEEPNSGRVIGKPDESDGEAENDPEGEPEQLMI